MSSNLVKPSLPSGFKDYTSEQVLLRTKMIRAIEATYRLYGFVPLQTSIAQRRITLTGGEPTENRLWNMRVDKSEGEQDDEHQITARFDLTVPLARFVAENMNEISFPFRRFEIGDVFRGESAQAGRYCEFSQFDADIVGAPAGPADAEIIRCMADVMQAVGVSRFLIKVNNRKVLNGLAEQVGFVAGSESAGALLRTLDKADRIGIEGVVAELRSKTSIEGEDAFAFDEEKINRIIAFTKVCDDAMSNPERIEKLRVYFDGIGIGAEGVEELAQIVTLLQYGGMPESCWTIDPSIARGLGYYTGTVFETILLDKPEFGSVYSGGRYDDLVARFTGDSLPSVGCSVGVDRLFAALEIIGALPSNETNVDVFIISMDPLLLPDYFAIANELRTAGIRTEIGMSHQDTSNRAQMQTALTRGAKYLIFFGKDDMSIGTIGLKNTITREQQTIKRADLVSTIKKTLTTSEGK